MNTAPKRRDDDFDFICRFVQDRSAIVLDESKAYLVDARLGPLIEKAGLSSIGELVAELRKAPYSSPLAQDVVEAMTTNETSFFRDIAPFDCLKNRVLPDLIAARGHAHRLNLWCAASSSGQEPYSILLTLKEVLQDFDAWKLHLLATDISKAMVARTQSGQYSQLEVNRGLPAKMLVKNFVRKGVKWQVKPELREMVEAREVNLIERWPPMANLDIVFIRNVLIYFDVPTKKDILRRAKSVMAPDGYLFLGGAETTIGIDDDFERVDFPNASCYRLRTK